MKGRGGCTLPAQKQRPHSRGHLDPSLRNSTPARAKAALSGVPATSAQPGDSGAMPHESGHGLM